METSSANKCVICPSKIIRYSHKFLIKLQKKI